MPPSPLMIAEASSRRGKTHKLGTIAKAIALKKKKIAKEMNSIRRGIKPIKAVKLSKRELAKITTDVSKMVDKEIGSTLRRSARIATRRNKNINMPANTLSKSQKDKIVKSATSKTLKVVKNSLPTVLHPSVFNPKYAELKRKYDATWKNHLSLIKNKGSLHGSPPRENANATVNSLANIFERVIKGSYNSASNTRRRRHHLHNSKRNSKSLRSKLGTIAENANE